MIAAIAIAIALANDIPLYTFNPKDFDGIGNLTVVALPHPGQGSVPAEPA